MLRIYSRRCYISWSIFLLGTTISITVTLMWILLHKYCRSWWNVCGYAHAQIWTAPCFVLVTSQSTYPLKCHNGSNVNQFLAFGFLVGATFSPTLKSFTGMPRPSRIPSFNCWYATHSSFPLFDCFLWHMSPSDGADRGSQSRPFFEILKFRVFMWSLISIHFTCMPER